MLSKRELLKYSPLAVLRCKYSGEEILFSFDWVSTYSITYLARKFCIIEASIFSGSGIYAKHNKYSSCGHHVICCLRGCFPSHLMHQKISKQLYASLDDRFMTLGTLERHITSFPTSCEVLRLNSTCFPWETDRHLWFSIPDSTDGARLEGARQMNFSLCDCTLLIMWPELRDAIGHFFDNFVFTS